MRQCIVIVASVLTALLVVPLTSLAQMPEGVRKPNTVPIPVTPSVPSVPSRPSVPAVPSPAVPSKDALLTQANGVVSDLTSLKNSGKLAAPQAKQVDTLLPKATSMAGELAKPRPDPTTTLHEVIKEADRLEETINDLLLLARGAAGAGNFASAARST
jgi:hypothetical protein